LFVDVTLNLNGLESYSEIEDTIQKLRDVNATDDALEDILIIDWHFH
jgi:hypothetical protein